MIRTRFVVLVAATLMASVNALSANADECAPCQTYVGGPYGWVLPSGVVDKDGQYKPCPYQVKTCVRDDDKEFWKGYFDKNPEVLRSLQDMQK